MRTTLNLDDELMRAVKQRAAEIGSTMTEIFEQALREHLRRDTELDPTFEFRWVTVKGRVLPGVDITDRDALYEQMEGRSGVEKKVSDETPARREGARRPSAKDKRR